MGPHNYDIIKLYLFRIIITYEIIKEQYCRFNIDY